MRFVLEMEVAEGPQHAAGLAEVLQQLNDILRPFARVKYFCLLQLPLFFHYIPAISKNGMEGRILLPLWPQLFRDVLWQHVRGHDTESGRSLA